MVKYFSASAFLYGVPVGFVFSFALGPIFFTLITTSLERGFKAALSIALGVIMADLVLLGIAYGGVETFLPTGNIDVTFWVELLGGVFLIALGVAAIMKKPRNTEGVKIVYEKQILKNISIGFFLNIFNPANFFEWVGAVSVLKSKYNFETFENVSFFFGALLAVLVTELSIAYFASRLRKVLNNRVMYIVNLMMGAVFISSGIWLLWEAIN